MLKVWSGEFVRIDLKVFLGELTDTKNAVVKTGKQVGHALRGNSQYAGFGAIAIAAAGTYAWQNGGADYVRQNGTKAVSKIVSEINIAKARKQMKRYL